MLVISTYAYIQKMSGKKHEILAPQSSTYTVGSSCNVPVTQKLKRGNIFDVNKSFT